MPEALPLRIGIFCEDAAHEDLARALIARCCAEEGIQAGVNTVSARFGIGRLKAELRTFQATVRKGGARTPDILVVLVDANREGVAARRQEARDVIDAAVFPAVVVGVPDPYVERWFLSDPVSFSARFGVQPELGPTTDRKEWKRRLVAALESAGQIVTGGGSEFAEDILADMDFYRAGRAVPSLADFVEDLRGTLRRLGRA